MRIRTSARPLLATLLVVLLGVATAQRSLTVAQGTAPETLDAQRSTVQQTLNVTYHINEPLFQLDYATNDITPLLGASYEAVDETTWEVKLQGGVRFTNGEPFNAEVVRYSLLRVKKPELNSPATIYVRPIVDVQVVDDTTVRIITDGPAPVLPLYLTRISMVPPAYIEEVGDDAFGQNPVGTGPYELVRWVKDDRVVLQANTEYWRGAPSLDQITFVSIPETATRMAALQTGEADLVTQVAIDQAPLLERAGITIAPVPGLRLMMVAFSLDGEPGSTPLYDVRVRQALNYAVDKQAIVDDILGGYGKVLAGQALSSEYFGFNPAVEAYPYDPERARELLAEAGYTADNPLSITIYGPQGRYVRDSEVVQAIAGQLREAGVEAEVEILEWGLFINRLLAKDFETAAFWGASTVPDADAWIGAMLGTGAAYSVYSNPELDELVAEGARTVDRDARLAIYHQAAELIHEQAPFIFLYQQVDVYGVSPRVEGWVPSPDESIYLWGVTVD
ncbi:MAG TPA: ABC transporter substrate-binding protein [Trueperaceae bacterium]